VSFLSAASSAKFRRSKKRRDFRSSPCFSPCTLLRTPIIFRVTVERRLRLSSESDCPRHTPTPADSPYPDQPVECRYLCLLQCLVQYSDIPTASNAAQTLEGYTIFEGCCRLRISFSRHTELNVKFQSERSRDYTVS